VKVKKWAATALRAAWRRTAAINLIVTRRCDLACGYCQAVRPAKELPAEDWLRMARALSQRFSVFTVSGGEPLLYKRLPELINGLSRIGIAGLCSNVRMLTASHLDAMRGLDYLNFSIDHPAGADDDERISRKDAFGKLPLLIEHAERHDVELFGTAVITRRNLAVIPDLVREMARHGIPLNLQLVQRPGPADAFDTPAKLGELARLQHELLAMKHGGYPIDESDDYLRGMSAFAAGGRAVACLAGTAYLAVDTDGRLMPCQASAAIGLPILETPDLDAALRALPQSVADGCRCWWNCYHRYQDWQRNPWSFMARAGFNVARGTGRLAA